MLGNNRSTEGQKMYDLSIGIMACTTKKRYIDEIRNCAQTWVAEADNLHVPVRFFTGETVSGFESQLCESTQLALVHLQHVGDDRASATQKQWLGYLHLHQTLPAAFYLIVGTDNYVWIARLLKFCAAFRDHPEPLCLTGAWESRRVQSRNMAFPLGGCGILLSHAAMTVLAPEMPSFQKRWYELCQSSEGRSFRQPTACDVALGYFLEQYEIPAVRLYGLYPVDWRKKFGRFGYWPAPRINFEKLAVCHFMDDLSMQLYHRRREDSADIEAIMLEFGRVRRECEATMPGFCRVRELANLESAIVTRLMQICRERTTSVLFDEFVLNQKYRWLRETPSDIYAHLPTLRRYARDCRTIVECGVRTMDSSWAFAKGLLDDADVAGKMLVSINRQRSQNVEDLQAVTRRLSITYLFVEGEDTKVALPVEHMDLLFLDTWHVYGHLRQEFATFAHRTRRYIILHDTTIDATIGESVRNGWDIEQQANVWGYTYEEVRKGIWPAIAEFLNAHEDWCLEQRFTNNNGLTILARRNIDPFGQKSER